MVRRIIFSLFMVMVIFSFNSAEAQITIVGQNNPAVDIQAAQKAVDQGGTVNLKGTFDFGNEGRVNITKDVQIIGETNDKGTPITKIKGGFWTFYSPLPAKLPPESPGPKITIQTIHFDGALYAPILLAYCNGATISNNQMTNVKPKLMDVPIFGKPGLYMQQGILCSTVYTQPRDIKGDIPNAITGKLIIDGNDIDLTNDVPTKTMAQGIFLLRTTGVNAQIQRNTIMNCSRNPIEALNNLRDADGSGTIVIKDNKIVTATEGLPVPVPATPIGIVVGWLGPGLDPQRDIKHIVVNNAIRTRGKTSIGIASLTDGAVIVNNAIVSEGTEAISLAIRGSDGYIAYNRIEGVSSRPGVVVGPFKPFKGSKNVFADNDLKEFKTPVADVLFEKETSNNLFIGHSCKVSDLGSNNSIQVTK